PHGASRRRRVRDFGGLAPLRSDRLRGCKKLNRGLRERNPSAIPPTRSPRMAGIARTQCLRQWLLGCLKRCAWIALAAGVMAAQAGTMPNAGRPVTITAREQPIGAFLQDLFATMDVPASISPGVTGNVNGTFSGPAEKVLRDMARVYNLITYFDGSVMHVGPANEQARRTYAVAPAIGARLLREVADMNLTDGRNTLRRSADGNMVAAGARRF